VKAYRVVLNNPKTPDGQPLMMSVVAPSYKEAEARIEAECLVNGIPFEPSVFEHLDQLGDVLLYSEEAKVNDIYLKAEKKWGEQDLMPAPFDYLP